MVKKLISDFSRTLLFPKDPSYSGSLNDLYRQVKESPDFNFWDHFIWNDRLHKIYTDLAISRNISLSIFTTDKIQEDPALIPYIETMYSDVFTLKDLPGLTKDNFQAYKILAEKLYVQPEEVLFIDDSDQNVIAAQEAGLITIKYRNIDQLVNDLNIIGLGVDS